MGSQADKELAKQKLLAKRLRLLAKHDELLLTDGHDLITGVDEVGRGSLIGPVVAASVIFPITIIQKPPKALIGLDDSKAAHLTHSLRTTLVSIIKEYALGFAIAEATQQEVETLNIHHASLLACERAVVKCIGMLESKGDNILTIVDGRTPLKKCVIADRLINSKAIIKGDAKSLSIAAASILAKVYRDNWVLNLCNIEPDLGKYSFQTNMGYATPPHRKALLNHGPCRYHRKTFLGKILAEQLQLHL